MKSPNLLVILPLALLLAACGEDETTPPPKAAHHGGRSEENQGDSEPGEKHPRVGMSEHQIREMYGDPDEVTHSSGGEVWHYWFNKGHAFIPYNFGYHARTGTFIFNEEGRLTSFDYNE